MAKQQHSAFILSLVIFACLLSFTMATGTRSGENEREKVRRHLAFAGMNSEPVRPPSPVIQTLGSSSEQARDLNEVDDNASNQEQTTWCIAKPSTAEAWLIANQDYCFNKSGIVDCKIIEPGGECYDPITNVSHASVVMNLYYQALNRATNTCDFTNTGLIISQDPSVGKCIYKVNDE